MKTIVWDLDDVLNPLLHCWFEEWRKANCNCTLDYTDLTENPPHRLLGLSLSDYMASLDSFRLTRVSDLVPNAQLFEWFQQNGARFHHTVLTAPPLCAVHVSAEWVFRHFGRWIRSFHFVPSPRDDSLPEIYDQTKEDVLRRLGGFDVLIDDSPAHVHAARVLGMQTILFPQPWNASKSAVDDCLARITDA